MKYVLALLTTFACFTFVTAHAHCGKCGPQKPAPSIDTHSLTDAMEHMQEQYKGLARGLRSAPKAEEAPRYLEMVHAFQMSALEAKTKAPEMVKRIKSPTERAAMEKGFRKALVNVLITSLELEQALLDGNMDTAKAKVSELKTMKSEGHDKFIDENQ